MLRGPGRGSLMRAMGKAPVMAAATAAPVESGGDSRLARGGVAALRIGVALLWIQNVAWKVPPDFGEHSNTGLYFFTRFAVDRPVFPLMHGSLNTWCCRISPFSGG